MQDNENVYIMNLTNEEFQFVEQLQNEYIEKLNKMTLEERLQYFKEHYCIERNISK